jgi:hypothetical protein
MSAAAAAPQDLRFARKVSCSLKAVSLLGFQRCLARRLALYIPLMRERILAEIRRLAELNGGSFNER